MRVTGMPQNGQPCSLTHCFQYPSVNGWSRDIGVIIWDIRGFADGIEPSLQLVDLF